MAARDGIILGEGVFEINGVKVALTRGGGQWVVEREYRQIEADGDYGPVKGRIRKIRSTARLTMNALEVLVENIPKLYPAVEVDSSDGTDTVTAKEDIEDEDYLDSVTWTGRTVGGRACVIKLENAINLGNIDWTMVDKEEIVPQVIYTATYDEDERTKEPWEVTFTDVA